MEARAKDAEQFEDRLRIFINDANKFENRLGKIRDVETTLVFVKKFMSESLVNFSFSGATMTYDALITQLENTILDKVTSVQSFKSKQGDTSSRMDIRMALKVERVGKDEARDSEEQWELA